MNILGVSGLYHDSAACLLRDGEIVAAAQEERFTRRKHDATLPVNAIRWCLAEGGIGKGQLDAVAFYDKPLTKFTRLLTTFAAVAPRGIRTFLAAIPAWLRDKAWSPLQIERLLRRTGVGRPRAFWFPEHHVSHAASAFYPSPFEEAAVVTVDGVGEWATTSVGVGEGNRIRTLFEQRFPHSLGLLYSAFTYYCGFRVNSGEYKLMGLAPYGTPVYADRIRQHLLHGKEDGSFRLDLRYFNFLSGLTMTSRRFHELFGGPPRKPESELGQREMDLAASIQLVTEEQMMRLARYAAAVTGKKHLCMAGGVALNCVANGKIWRSGIFDDVFIQPAAGDAGGALGAALYVWHAIGNRPRTVDGTHDSMRGSYLGPSFAPARIREFLELNGYPCEELADDDDRARRIAAAVADGKVVGLFRGRMEFGPRALGNRSILADARSPRTQSYLNLATKFRESFRPFAPIVIREDAHRYFERIVHSPYMLLVDRVRPERCVDRETDARADNLTAWVNEVRSDIPAVTHVDYSARIQTVDRDTNPTVHAILSAFRDLTGESLMVNTSFNLRGEPIVCTPEDAYRCFMRSGMDLLVLENLVLQKAAQPAWSEPVDWKIGIGLD